MDCDHNTYHYDNHRDCKHDYQNEWNIENQPDSYSGPFESFTDYLDWFLSDKGCDYEFPE